jgi:hypothetical protein
MGYNRDGWVAEGGEATAPKTSNPALLSSM